MIEQLCHFHVIPTFHGPSVISRLFCAFKFFCLLFLRKRFLHFLLFLMIAQTVNTCIMILVLVLCADDVWSHYNHQVQVHDGALKGPSGVKASCRGCQVCCHAWFLLLFFSSLRSVDPSVNLLAVLFSVEALVDVQLHHFFLSDMIFLNSFDCKSRVYFFKVSCFTPKKSVHLM